MQSKSFLVNGETAPGSYQSFPYFGSSCWIAAGPSCLLSSAIEQFAIRPAAMPYERRGEASAW